MHRDVSVPSLNLCFTWKEKSVFILKVRDFEQDKRFGKVIQMA